MIEDAKAALIEAQKQADLAALRLASLRESVRQQKFPVEKANTIARVRQELEDWQHDQANRAMGENTPGPPSDDA